MAEVSAVAVVVTVDGVVTVAVAVAVAVAVISAQRYDPQCLFFPKHKQTITHYTQQVSNRGYEFTVFCNITFWHKDNST
jgi:hypothetical protein